MPADVRTDVTSASLALSGSIRTIMRTGEKGKSIALPRIVPIEVMAPPRTEGLTFCFRINVSRMMVTSKQT